MPGSELDTRVGAGAQRASVRCGPVLLGLVAQWFSKGGPGLRIWGLVLSVLCLSTMFLLWLCLKGQFLNVSSKKVDITFMGTSKTALASC